MKLKYNCGDGIYKMLDGNISCSVYYDSYHKGFLTLHLNSIPFKFICRECGMEIGSGVVSGELDELDMKQGLTNNVFDGSDSFFILNTVCEKCRLEEEQMTEAFTNSVNDESYIGELFDGLMSAT